MEQTFAMIKPDAVARNLTGQILAMMEKDGLRVVAMKMMHMSRAQAEGFYGVHKDKPFFDSLVSYMISGPVVCLVLQGENAIARYRTLMGATNPEKAAEGTIRRTFAQSLQANSVHGSDGADTACFETRYFFSELEKVNA